jgi:predicted adenine nucleotide alpha hydrolase (AANH) superfamily ATPase
MTKLLLHICCAPCAAYSVPALREEGMEVTGYYSNPNIHPEGEYRRREEALRAWQPSLDAEIIYDEEYDCGDYFDAVISRGSDRCRQCYELRLRKTAREAKRRSIGIFSSTLLFSIYQKHELLRETGERVGREEGVPFHYRDLRTGWREGQELYRPSGLYRQNYCGCVFSEKERLERKKGKPA